MKLEAPQYRGDEALEIAVLPHAFLGDLDELTVLNQYIGVHVPPTLPQFAWLPVVLTAAAALGFAGGFLPPWLRRRVLPGVSAALALALLAAAVQAKSQIHDIGHKRDQKPILTGVSDFTPPFLGTAKIAQFTVSSGFGPGAWLIGAALVLQLGAAGLSRSQKRSMAPDSSAFNSTAPAGAKPLASTVS